MDLEGDLEIIETQFIGRCKYGDFDWMIKQTEYSNALFIFNDDEERHGKSVEGKGNAVIRKYNKHSVFNPPKSAGIPTGTMKRGGYKNLTSRSKFEIDQSIKEIKELIKKHNYKKIFYSASKDCKLGTSIFKVGDDVIDYITFEIKNLK